MHSGPSIFKSGSVLWKPECLFSVGSSDWGVPLSKWIIRTLPFLLPLWSQTDAWRCTSVTHSLTCDLGRASLRASAVQSEEGELSCRLPALKQAKRRCIKPPGREHDIYAGCLTGTCPFTPCAKHPVLITCGFSSFPGTGSQERDWGHGHV